MRLSLIAVAALVFSACNCSTRPAIEDGGVDPLLPECVDTSECPLGKACEDGRCVVPGTGVDGGSLGCMKDGDCPSGQKCIPSTGTCFTPVENDGGASEPDGGMVPLSTCSPGESQSCGSSKLGACKLGTTACEQKNGAWNFGACVGAVDPKAETCNGIDDDCDGIADDALGTATCGVGECARTVSVCEGGTPITCQAGPPSAEVCDGKDNDCDGAVDEMIPALNCGVGSCARTVPACSNGQVQTCSPGTPTAEVCNGQDDDCNGTADDGFGVSTCGIGACARMTPSCVNGMPQSCTAGMPVAEICNGLDDDCDGSPDDGLGNFSCGQGACARQVPACINGQLQMCVQGQPGTEVCNGQDDDCDGATDEMLGSLSCGVGACAAMVDRCVNGTPQTCNAGQPGTEVCNGQDDDCDGTPDDNLGTSSCGLGICARTVNVCLNGSLQMCQPGQGEAAENCNNTLDDDCDGLVNDGCACTGNQTQSCYTGANGTAGVGPCKAGTQTCSNGAWGPCVGQVTPQNETCNSVDDDCDATVDDNIGQQSCGQGVCRRTVDNCVNGTAQTCQQGQPAAEVCDNLDNDCDGATDEMLGNLTCGQGACFRQVPACAGGTVQTCNAGQPSPEICDNVDNDCDGATDEGLGNLTCGQGACFRSVPACVNGSANTCVEGQPTAEVCDGDDDDCDGAIDDGLGTVSCGQGLCSRTVSACVNGMNNTCVEGQPATEVCDNLDNDCDGATDEMLGTASCGQGVCANTVQVCVNGMNQMCTAGTPGTEVCNNLDDDCDGSTDESFPQSGQSCTTTQQGRCAAGTFSCGSGALNCVANQGPISEICGNNIDDDCNGVIDNQCGCSSTVDNDFDGSNQCLDCNDNDGTIRPGAMEKCNGKDDDCDGSIDEGFDVDNDGFTTCGTVVGGGIDTRRIDCNDANAFVFPLKTTDCGAAASPNSANNVDDNCNGYVDETCGCNATRDRDGDGANECVDCEDNDAAMRPGGTEICDGKDNDCNRATVDNCGVSQPCGYKQGPSYLPWPTGTDVCRPDLVCVSNLSTGALTCGSFCNQTTGTGLNDSCATGEGCYRNLVDSDNLHLCSVLTTGAATTGASCASSGTCRSGDCLTSDGPAAYCSDKCTHESGCSSNTTCHVQKAPLTSGPFQIGNYYYSFCRLDSRITATKNTGDTCTTATECRGGTDMCIGGRCAEPCCTHADCGAGYSCRMDGARATTGYQNGAGEGIDSVVPACRQTTGPRLAGASCATNAECRSQICDRNLNVCVDPCCSSATCANGTSCQPINLRYSDGRVTYMRACIALPGPARVEQK